MKYKIVPSIILCAVWLCSCGVPQTDEYIQLDAPDAVQSQPMVSDEIPEVVPEENVSENTEEMPAEEIVPEEPVDLGPVIETIDGCTYADGVLIVNKSYPVPEDFGDGITAETQAAFDAMQSAAAQEGITLFICSGFRSYSYQNTLYNNYVARDGQNAADTYSARPGHSEHQTGLAVDVNSTDGSMATSPEGLWLAEHCAEYGFVIRYPKGKEEITGYMYEPWHIRYLGTDLAVKLTQDGLTLEEYFGLTSVYAETD